MKKTLLIFSLLSIFSSTAFSSHGFDLQDAVIDKLKKDTSVISYLGKLKHNNAWSAVKTSFFSKNLTADFPDISGSYIFYEGSNKYYGELVDCKIRRTTYSEESDFSDELYCIWVDDWGNGYFLAKFPKDLKTFEGEYGGDISDYYYRGIEWDGRIDDIWVDWLDPHTTQYRENIRVEF